MRLISCVVGCAVRLGALCGRIQAQQLDTAANLLWNAPDRGVKVARLIPGRKLPHVMPDTLFAEWTRAQVARWDATNPHVVPEEAFVQYQAASPTDAELVADFPRHISPFGRVRSGDVAKAAAKGVLISYCPFCQSQSLRLSYDEQNEYHATALCCGTELYGHESDFPPGYALKPNTAVSFHHLDDTRVAVPCTLYRDRNGVEWELFIKTLFDQRRWLRVGGTLIRSYGQEFRTTADPRYAHKIAVLLDHVADTYYGLPLSYCNQLAAGKDDGSLTRAEWEAPRPPGIFEVGELGGWNRRTPIFNKGWINMSDEHIWVEPFARVRHHPAFKYYSQRKYGDPDALDRKIMEKLLCEVALMFRNCFSQKLLTNYQEANYVHLWLLGVLVQDELLIEFAAPAQEVAMYNHTYQDGMNGEGAPNYMAMPGGYFYPYLRDPNGWLEFSPQFLDDHPFYWAANDEMRKLRTVRGVQVEFGDQHEYAFPRSLITTPAQVCENERIGSRNWAGYGVGILRVGGPGHRQELCLSYTRATLHNARDALSLGCWVDGVPVMRRGGYVAHSCTAWLQWERPEFQTLKAMDYPHEIAQSERWAYDYAHTPLCQNGVTVDEVATGKGWGDNRGYGEVITFKGGEPGGEPGSGFQVLDVRDHYSWARMDKDVPEFRRTLIGVEGPDGRPYVLDLLKLRGGTRHAFYQSAWADRVAANLPPAASQAPDLAQAFFGDSLPEDDSYYRTFRHIRHVARHAEPGATWGVTWRTNMAAYAPRDPSTGRIRSPLPSGVGDVRLRLIGVSAQPEETELISAQGPWIGRITQPLLNGQRVDGDVAFMDSRDFLIEHRTTSPGKEAATSLFVHVLEGYRTGEASAIKALTRLPTTSLAGAARDTVALALVMAGGHTDTVVYQSAAGTVRLPNGIETDARYAVLRHDAQGDVIAAEACRGSFLKCGTFSVTLPGDFTGTIADIAGDITGTRQESALIITPDRPWPDGAALTGRQLLIRIESPLRDACNEGYRVERVTTLRDGRVRVDLQDHAPLVTSWHQVTMLPADRPNVLRTNRPMVAHGNNPWYNGLKVWFPERDKTFTIKNVNRVGGGYGGDTLEVVEDVSFAAEGIRLGDWYVIYGIQPGCTVTVPNDFCWRREPAAAWGQHALRAPGNIKVESPVTQAPLAYRVGDAAWREIASGKQVFTAAETGGQNVKIVSNRPKWLKLNDTSAPEFTAIALDGRDLSAKTTHDLGWIDSPRRLTLRCRDAINPIDTERLSVRLNGERLDTGDAGVVTVTMSEQDRAVEVAVALDAALADEQHRPRKHVIRVEVADRSVDGHRAVATVSFINRVPLLDGVIYLSDLKPERASAHGGLIRDRDYVGNVAEIAGRIYPKCLTLCPKRNEAGDFAEAVYRLPGERPGMTFRAEIGISDSAGGQGSVVFTVQAGTTLDGQWRTLYSSNRVSGGAAPKMLKLPLGNATFLRLHTTDGGDSINSDHAVWGNARLE